MGSLLTAALFTTNPDSSLPPSWTLHILIESFMPSLDFLTCSIDSDLKWKHSLVNYAGRLRQLT